jgi:CRP/FNR family transcriptional regulator, cyclic AMP receptor protein
MTPHLAEAALATVQANPWFASLNNALQVQLLSRSEPLQLGRGEMALRQHAEAHGFFVLLSGSLKASTLRADGREAILAVIDPGNWFGEISLLDGLPRTHDITALQPSSLLVVSAADFAALMQRSDFSRAISVLLAGRVRALYGLVEDATLRSTRARVARRLLLLARGDVTGASDVRATVPVSHEALAMMLGMTRQTLAKELKALVAAGAVALHYRRIDITSTAQLEALGEVSGKRLGEL